MRSEITAIRFERFQELIFKLTSSCFFSELCVKFAYRKGSHITPWGYIGNSLIAPWGYTEFALEMVVFCK